MEAIEGVYPRRGMPPDHTCLTELGTSVAHTNHHLLPNSCAAPQQQGKQLPQEQRAPYLLPSINFISSNNSSARQQQRAPRRHIICSPADFLHLLPCIALICCMTCSLLTAACTAPATLR